MSRKLLKRPFKIQVFGRAIIAVRVVTHKFLSKPARKHSAIFDDIKRFVSPYMTYLPNSKKITADFSMSKLMAEWLVMDFKKTFCMLKKQ